MSDDKEETVPPAIDPEVNAPTDAEPVRTVHLPSLVSDEFGMDRTTARQLVHMGVVTVADTSEGLDEEDVEFLKMPNKLDVAYDDIIEKWIRITADPEMTAQSVQFKYRD